MLAYKLNPGLEIIVYHQFIYGHLCPISLNRWIVALTIGHSFRIFYGYERKFFTVCLDWYRERNLYSASRFILDIFLLSPAPTSETQLLDGLGTYSFLLIEFQRSFDVKHNVWPSVRNPCCLCCCTSAN